jgi:hypothetical protein
MNAKRSSLHGGAQRAPNLRFANGVARSRKTAVTIRLSDPHGNRGRRGAAGLPDMLFEPEK